MKIGILTHPLMYNYGGILQNYALQCVLKDLGHEVLTVDRRPNYKYGISIYAIVDYLRRLCYNAPQHRVTRWNPILPINQAEYCAVSSNINTFIEKNIDRTVACFDDELSAIDDRYKFDCYVVGSDQVWGPGCCPLMFIDFSKRCDVIKLFYAASAGEKTWMDVPEKLDMCLRLSKQFRAISVREEELRRTAESVLYRQVQVVLDPTMLLDVNRYFDEGLEPSQEKNYVFAYILDNTSVKQDSILKATSFLDTSLVSGFTIDNSKIIKTALPSVEEWIDKMYNAQYIVTDSFHGCVFAILFKKQFSVIVNKKRGQNRFFTLLSKFGLLDRIVFDDNGIEKNINTPIDYKSIEELLVEEREKSLYFIKSSLQE